MLFSTAIVALTASVASASYIYGNETTYDTGCYTTVEVVSEYETYCDKPTTYVEGTKTYQVTKPTTLTITDCPYGCTITKTYTSDVHIATETGDSYPPSKPGKSYPPSKPGKTYPPPPKGTGSSYSPPGNSTKPTKSYSPGSPSSPTESPLQGSAGRVTVAGGALGGLFVMMVYLL
jgi:hypothetical protein